jgi:hypothetical protein
LWHGTSVSVSELHILFPLDGRISNSQLPLKLTHTSTIILLVSRDILFTYLFMAYSTTLPLAQTVQFMMFREK